MTRINLVPVQELADQHLFAEYRELPRVFGKVREHISKGRKFNDLKIPRTFVLGTGHMTFFYNKLKYLVDRHGAIVQECLRRGINISNTDLNDISDLPEKYCNDYYPLPEEIEISKSRLIDRYNLKPQWYKFTKVTKPEYYN